MKLSARRRTRRFLAIALITLVSMPSSFGLRLAYAVPSVQAASAVTIIAPLADATLTGTVQVTATVVDFPDVTGVQFKLDGVNLGSPVTVAPYQLDWDTTTVVSGGHTLIAQASDIGSNVIDSSAVNVTVDNPPVPDTTSPTVTVVSPDGSTTLAGNVSVEANATDNISVVGVQFLLDGGALGTEATAVPFTVTWDTTSAVDGAHSLSALARDAAGNTGTALTVLVNVHNAPPPGDVSPPTISITKPTPDAIVSGVVPVSADASDDVGVAGVRFYLDSAPYGPEDTFAPYETTWDTLGAGDGSHTLTAVARDSVGNATTGAGHHVTVNNTGVVNTNNGDVQNGGIATANTGGNSSTGHDDSHPTTITTGDANAGVAVPNQINTNITDVVGAPGADGSVSVVNENQAHLENTTSASATTGDNTASNNRFSQIATGAAQVFTTIVNAVNTSITGTNFGALVDSFFTDYTGSINFLDQFLAMLLHDTPIPTNLQVNNISTGDIINNVEVNASTGNNVSDNSRQAVITTGDINVGMSIFNLLNTNIVGSNWLFSTLNIFGNFTGDIILPGIGVMPNSFADQSVTAPINNQNIADINNTLDVVGDTGNNNATGNRDGARIYSGDVNVQTSVINQVNTNLIGANFFSFLPHLFGNWTGQVIDPGAAGYQNIGLADSETALTVDNTNDATINNHITVNAVTGQNKATGNRFAAITTGDINVGTNLINVANTNIVGANWFLGNVNMYGSWTGNLVYAYPDLALGLDAQPEAKLGQDITYTFHVSNPGLAPARDARLTAQLPTEATFVSATNGGTLKSGTVEWNFGILPQHAADRTVRVTVHVPDTLPVGETLLTQNAHVSTTTNEPQKANNAAVSQTSVVVAPALHLEKTNSATSSVLPGTDVTYTLAITNTGNVDVTNLIIHDQLANQAGVTLFAKDFTTDTLVAGAATSFQYTLTVNSNSPAGVYTNTATATAKYQGTDIPSAVASSSVTVVLPPPPVPAPKPAPVPVPRPNTSPTSGAASSSTWAPAPTSTATLGLPTANQKQTLVVKHSSSAKTARQGDKVTFRVSTYNPSKQPLTNVMLTSKLTNGKTNTLSWKIGTLRAGEEIVLSYTLNLVKTAKLGTYKNVAVATGKGVDGKTIRSTGAPVQFAVRAYSAATARFASSTTSVTLAKKHGSIRRSGNNGLLFSNDNGQGITAWQYAQLNGESLIDVLASSKDPNDRAFIAVYKSGLALVGKPGKSGAIITSRMVLQDLQKRPQFVHIFGKAILALATSR